jgi:olfactory receptor
MRPTPSTPLDKFLAIFDAHLIPFLNPVIYMFRNREIKVAMRRVFNKLLGCRKTT